MVEDHILHFAEDQAEPGLVSSDGMAVMADLVGGSSTGGATIVGASCFTQVTVARNVVILQMSDKSWEPEHSLTHSLTHSRHAE